MEGMRGVAILLVFVCHFQIVVASALSPVFRSVAARVLAQAGGTGVDLFFLLSGFLIYRAALRRDLRLGTFLRRRVQRIYPTFLVVFAIYCAIASRAGVDRIPHTAAAALGYIVANVLFLPGVADIPALLSAAWSLSYEFAFYLLLPFLVRLLHLYSWPSRARALSFAAVVVLHLAIAYLHPTWFPAYHYYDGSFVRFVMFLSGMIIYEVTSGPSAERLTPSRQAVLLAVAAMSVVAFIMIEVRTVGLATHESIPHNAVRAACLFLAFSSIALTSLTREGVLREAFSIGVLRWTGNVSYSLYLIHGLVLNAMAALALHLGLTKAHPIVSAGLLFVASLGAAAAAAFGLYLTVESPLSLQTQKLSPDSAPGTLRVPRSAAGSLAPVESVVS